MIPGVSDKVNAESLVDEGDGRKFMFKSFLDGTTAHRCLQEGKFRAEFYLNDQLVANQPVTLTTSPFEAAAFRDMDIAMCHPQGWVRWAPKEGDDPGLVRGFTDKQRDRGAFVFTDYYPKMEGEEIRRDKFLRKSANYMLARNLFSESQLSGEPASCTAFPESGNVMRVRFGKNGTTVMARSWVEGDGTVYVGIVYRRAGVIDPANRHAMEMEDCGMLLSFTTLY
jgi:hypothetical protein